MTVEPRLKEVNIIVIAEASYLVLVSRSTSSAEDFPCMELPLYQWNTKVMKMIPPLYEAGRFQDVNV